MSASFYTSFETSVALREAGAPQRPAWHVPTVCTMESHICWNKDGPEKPWLGPWIGDDFSVRAWRLDEILAALAELGSLNIHHSDREYDFCHVLLYECRGESSEAAGEAPSLVEAAAACYLAVLRAAREAAK